MAASDGGVRARAAGIASDVSEPVAPSCRSFLSFFLFLFLLNKYQFNIY
jgi:hypothetical protein